MNDLDDFLAELDANASPMFQMDLATGRVFRRGSHCAEYVEYEEVAK